jgi:hypothetical protein
MLVRVSTGLGTWYNLKKYLVRLLAHYQWSSHAYAANKLEGGWDASIGTENLAMKRR